MQSNKERSAEESYKKFLDIMLYDVPLNQLEELVANDVTGYGTTLDEKILEIERLRKLVIDQREQGAGYEINFVVNPVHRRINTDNGLAVFIDEIEITMSIDGNKNIIPLRFSSVLELINGSWKVVHLHGSVAVNTEGDTWHKEEHLRKIEELEKLVSEKTEDLVKKNRELEIEASLERVRAVAMSMNKSDDLISICEVSFKEFEKLGFNNIRNAIIHIPNDEQKYFMDYDYSELTGGAITKIEYGSHPIVDEYLEKISSSEDAYFEVVINEEQLEGWKNFRKKSGQVDDPRLDEATAIHYYLFSIGVGDIGISTFKPIDESQKKILKRFRNVFDLAYRRYNDIALAEAQARESQIQLALERVRARTIAMQKQHDLFDVVNAFGEQLVALGLRVDYVSFINGIISKDRDWDLWGCNPNLKLHAENNLIPYKKMAFFTKTAESVEKYESTGNPIQVKSFTKEEKDEFFDHYFSYAAPVPEEIKQHLYDSPGSIIVDAFLNEVTVSLCRYDLEPYTQEQLDIFRRFSNEFRQAYIRFLDLQKAEAQTREAQVQLALERVRARSLAMHHTSELQEVVNILAQQLYNMNIDINGGVFIVINDEVDEDIPLWASGGAADYLQKVIVPFLNKPVFVSLKDAIKRKNNFFTEEHGQEEKIALFEHLFKYPPWNSHSQQRKQELLSREGGYTRSVAISNLTSISITNHNGKKFSDDDNEILKRFGNVFEQSYIRFLDLQKAEAQAKESEIQLALERVRARTMAMQKSEELSETSFVLFTQLKELGEVAEQISILIYDEHDEILELYTTIYGNQWEESGRLPFNENPVHKKIYTTWKEKKKSIVIDISGDELTDFNNFKMKYSNQYKSESELPQNRWILHNAFFSKGSITYSTHEPRPTETITLLERFAAVFDLTYTRFLDLKRAEAQAREAQIEAALERIRSRSLAMQKSEELAETAAVLFQQLHELGYVPDRITIGIIKEDIRSIELWSTDQVGNKITHIFKPSIDETTTWSKIYHQWKAEAKSLVIDLSGIELNEWIRYVREEMNIFINEEVLKENRRVHSVSFFSHGFIMMSTIEAMPVEKIDVLERFSLVFNQTYTRFLDLQKAEAQAREAQIEVALERVRSKTLAMHTSEELADTAAVVFQQLINLGIEPNRIYIAILKNEKGDAEFWITDEDGSKVSSGFEINLNDNNSFKKMFEGWKGHKKSMIIDMHGEELKEYFNHLTKLNVPFKSGLSQKRRMQYLGYFSKGFIGVASPDETKPETLLLLERFAAVFNLTYTRFNDLLQAEEQNRIIQTENERKTKELEDARRLQISMLPKELPQLPRLDIAVYMKTTTEVGGDYYDFSIDNNGTLTFIVGDATGHGLMSGMMVSIMKSFFISNRNHISLKDFFENANNSIKDMKLGRLMMALMGVQITSDEIIATSAGMPPLIYFRNKSGKAGEFVINNLPLGGMKGIKYSQKKIKYEKGDTLLMMSDGFAELKNENHEQYGYTRIKEIFGSIVYKTSAEIVDELKNTAIQWLNGKEPDDDITFVVIKVK